MKAGLEENEVKEWLETGKGGPQVDKEVQDAVEQSISGVPHFEINGVYGKSHHMARGCMYTY